jgi:2-isopropylmalate synthase
VLGTTLEENLRMIADSVACCRAAGREVFYDAEHFFDGYRRNPEYALQTLRAAEEAGASVVILCDTNGGTLPEQVAEAVAAVRRYLRVELGIHCHNDSDVAVGNTLAGVRGGATQVQGTINGIGERCGNVDLVSVIANLALKLGYEVLRPESLRRLTELSRYVYETANMNFRSNQPFVGTSAFAHKGGMHTHAVAKVTASYEHLDPAQVGNERRILVSELSGQSTILTKTARMDVRATRRADGPDSQPGAALENEGYEFEAAEASFQILGARGGAVSAEVSAAGVPGEHRDGPRWRAGDRGNGEGARRRTGDAHRQRGRRPGQRPGRSAAQGTAAGVPEPE